MQDYQKAFIELSIQHKALCFGEFTLKSGRKSPYFFNAGLFQTGAALAALGDYYAQALLESGIDLDMLFGPAYKGIPLVAATAAALARDYQCDYPVCYNRKEVKNHGEGGLLVGAPLQGKVAIIDDVITAGTAVREVIEIVKQGGAEPGAVLIGLDRQERGQGDLSAIQEVEQTYAIPVISIVTLNDIIHYVTEHSAVLIDAGYTSAKLLAAMTDYRNQYGTA